MRSSSIPTGTTLGFMVLFASALITAPASTVHAQAFPSFNCDAPGANLQTKIDHAADGATIFFGGNCDDGPYFIDAGQNLHLRGFSSGGTLSASSGADCVVCIEFAHVKFTRLDIVATGAFAGISVFGGTANIGPDTNIDATGAENGILVDGGTVRIFQAVIHDSAGVGIHVRNSSTASISDSRIEDGDGDAIVIISSSSADISSNIITGNGGDGVSITFHSSVSLGGDPTNTIEDNTAFGVRCGVSGALVVFEVPDFGDGNDAGNAVLDPACELLNLSGDAFP